jgi:hypothetical protein
LGTHNSTNFEKRKEGRKEGRKEETNKQTKKTAKISDGNELFCPPLGSEMM